MTTGVLAPAALCSPPRAGEIHSSLWFLPSSFPSLFKIATEIVLGAVGWGDPPARTPYTHTHSSPNLLLPWQMSQRLHRKHRDLVCPGPGGWGKDAHMDKVFSLRLVRCAEPKKGASAHIGVPEKRGGPDILAKTLLRRLEPQGRVGAGGGAGPRRWKRQEAVAERRRC